MSQILFFFLVSAAASFVFVPAVIRLLHREVFVECGGEVHCDTSSLNFASFARQRLQTRTPELRSLAQNFLRPQSDAIAVDLPMMCAATLARSAAL